MGIQNGPNVPFLKSASLEKRKRNVMRRIKQFYKISIKGDKKKSCLLKERLKEAGNTEEGREFQRSGVEEKKPSLN